MDWFQFLYDIAILHEELKTEIYQIAILLRSLKRKALHKNFFIKDVFSECDQIHKKMRIGHIY